MATNPKVRVGVSPSQMLTADANQSHVVTDKMGRRITLQRPGMLAQYRLVRAVGADAAENRVYMNMLLPLTYVTEIDGAVVPPPSNQAQFDALIQRLDEHGLTACVAGIQQHWGGQQADPEESLQAVKA